MLCVDCVLQVGLESAGQHLADRFGEGFKTIWAVGLLASGQIATIGLTFAGQLVMSGLLNLKVGLTHTHTHTHTPTQARADIC